MSNQGQGSLRKCNFQSWLDSNKSVQIYETKVPSLNYLGDYERMTGFSENEQRGKSNQIHPMIFLKTCFWSNCEQL